MSDHRTTLTLPTGWESVEPPEGVRFLALAPESGTFRSNLTVTAQTNGDLGFRDWQVGSEMAFTEMMPGYTPIDLERLTIAGQEAGRRLAMYDGPGGSALTMEQWFVAIDGVGHTLTATFLTSDYATWAAEIDAAAATWSPA
ncbi:hypothetical protein ACIRON_26735 [Nocardioides sp. NPDC101246]|uniref:hypothetical protein n=1 Tax=Nocardioides sp. NPDC101246 TaxID=3364336 RepID=UPI0037F70153